MENGNSDRGLTPVSGISRGYDELMRDSIDKSVENFVVGRETQEQEAIEMNPNEPLGIQTARDVWSRMDDI